MVCWAVGGRGKLLRVVFRFDDPSPVSKHVVEERVFEALRLRGIPLTCAVIPARLRGGLEIRFTPETACHLTRGLASGLLEVALHGRLHRDAGMGRNGRPSEFEGVPIDSQREWISTGRDLLEAVFQDRVHGFVPPWNGYDSATLQVLQELGFSYLSADLSVPKKMFGPLRILPLTCNLRRLDMAIIQARRFERFAPVIVVVMHHYDFDRDADDPPCKPYTYEEFNTLLDGLVGLPRIRFCTLKELSDSMSSAANRVWVRQEQLQNLLPYRFKRLLPEACFLTRVLPTDL